MKRISKYTKPFPERANKQVIKPAAVDLSTHHLLYIREPGDALVALRAELIHHPEIFEYANEGKTMEDCLARIATKLDIAVDGLYIPEDFFLMLTDALRNKRMGMGESEYLKRAKGLVDAELVEKEGTLELQVREDAPLEPTPKLITLH